MASSDEERWLEAERRIAPQVSPQRRRAARRSWLLLICAALAYGTIVALVRAFASGGGPAPDAGSEASPVLWAGLALSAAGMLVVIAGLVAGLVTKRLRPTWDRVDGALTWQQSRAARRQIRGVEPLIERHRAVVRAIAEQDVRSATGLLPCYIGTAVMAGGLVLALALPEITVLIVTLLVVLAITAAWQYGVTARAARRYLAFG